MVLNCLLRSVLFSILLFCACHCTKAQFKLGVGVTYGADVYQHFRNPGIASDSLKYGLGSALFNFNIGPKFWMGVRDFSMSIEGQIGFAPFALDIDQYKGLGAFYFPVAVGLNYRGLSTFREAGGWGLGLAAGTQFTRTDVYFLKEEFEDIDRSFYQTIFGQLNFGFGSKYSSIFAYVRYGEGEMEAQNWNVGVMLDFNLTHRSKMKKEKAIIRHETDY